MKKVITVDTPLTNSDKRLIDEYFYCGCNGTEAYQRLHPKATYESAKAASSAILTKLNVKAEIRRRWDEKTMQADEAMGRLSDFARGDLGEFTNSFGGVDWVEAKAKGLTKLVKRWKVKTVTINGKKADDEDKEITTEEIELHDAQAALEKILRVHGKFIDRTDLTNSDGSLKPVINIYIPNNGRDNNNTPTE